jgi:branched-chain amino acid transport system ATP-binding protein
MLKVDKIVKNFGGFRALDGVSFELRHGEILGLVGPNGSGKTTCINTISGIYGIDSGAIEFQGRSLGTQAPHLITRLGINRSYQSPRPFLGLTVAENIAVAATYGCGSRPTPDTDEILAFVELDRVKDRLATELNSAQQKMLDLARALATAPSLLLIDELAAGFNPSELTKTAEKLRSLAAKGMTLLVVEHLLSFIERVTDRVIVLNAGREIFEGLMSEAVRDPEVVRVFLGKFHAA